MKNESSSDCSPNKKLKTTNKKTSATKGAELLDSFLSSTGLTPMAQQSIKRDLEEKLNTRLNCSSQNMGIDELRQVMLLYLEQVDALQQPDKRLYN